MSKIRRAACVMLDFLEDERKQLQKGLFEKVGEETGLAISTVRRHVYFGLLKKTGHVYPWKDGFEGPWYVVRSDKLRDEFPPARRHQHEE